MGKKGRARRRQLRATAPIESDVAPVYDLAYHHNNPESRHQHSPECEPNDHYADGQQFLRCLRVELDRIRKEAQHEGKRSDAP